MNDLSYLKRDEETICAISTARGMGGISVIRVSGDKAESLVRKLCPFLPKTCESHRIYYGFIKDFQSQVEIDEVLVSYFSKGRSFTGEKTLEISSHGGNFISQKIILELQKAGARMAERGEFTYRSFMNGRIDLTQAEGVLAIIEAESASSSRLALRQLKGRLSQTFKEIEDQLIWILAHLEAQIDFTSEDIVYSSGKELLAHGLRLQAQLDGILSTYEKGRQFKEGVQVSIIGKPNVGKSSLFNALLGEDRAIVSAQEGTTRDYIEGRILIEGVFYYLRDTAGLRDTKDETEKLGVERSLKSVEESDLIFLVLDKAQDLRDLKRTPKNSLAKWYFIFNKSDLIPEREQNCFLEEQIKYLLQWVGLSHKAPIRERCYMVSAENSTGLEPLLDSLKRFSLGRYGEDSAIITQARHFDLLKVASERLATAIELLRKEMSPEFIAFELQDSLVSIQRLLGKQYDDEVMDRIFKEFCLGK